MHSAILLSQEVPVVAVCVCAMAAVLGGSVDEAACVMCLGVC